MHPVLLSILQTCGIVALAVGGALAGGRLARGRFWLLGVAPFLVFLAAVALPHWVPRWTAAWPFRWFMLDRTVYAPAAAVIPLFFATLAGRLPRPRERRGVLALAGILVLSYAVPPFLGPALSFREVDGIQPSRAADGVCLQTTDYTCGPAAAATVLGRMGILTDERTVALAAHTNLFLGTSCGELASAMRRPGLRFRTEAFGGPLGLAPHAPCVAVVKHSLLSDHFVAVLAVDEATVTVGDPLSGRRTMSHATFIGLWRNLAVVREP